MALRLRDIVTFRGDRLFHGAVNIDWFLTDEEKCQKAAESFVFHGPTYHGVSQADIGSDHGHRLQDTASFTRSVVRRSRGIDDLPFTLAIAGYGTGKSHLALTLAVLLSNPSGETAESILSGIDAADAAIGADVRAILKEDSRPSLVLTLNGNRGFDLTAEINQQIVRQLHARELDTSPLEELRPRFTQAANLIRVSNESIINELLDFCNAVGIEALLQALEKQDERVYDKVQEFFASRGMPIRVLGGESLRDVIQVVSRSYCGEGKPFANLLILFDEFGRYTEFATARSQIAGSGVLQDLFEGIQAYTDKVKFVGFIQFELNAYVQRVAPELKNEILRYVTRYQSAASKEYLSINLETLIAHLFEKHKSEILNSWFDNESARRQSQETAKNLREWFPQSSNHRLWNSPQDFHTVIRKGCWPLSPFSTWFLFSLAAAGRHLQERSALTLLGQSFYRSAERAVADEGTWSLAPVDLWSDELQEELIGSEESGQQGAIAHAYASVQERHGVHLSGDLTRILRSIVLASKMGLKVGSRDEAISALSRLAGLQENNLRTGIDQLQEEYNVLEWDERFKAFDILGDAVPRTQFLSFIRNRVASTYDEDGKAKLFASKAPEWCDLLGDLECDFAEKNSITTKEWRYQGETSTLQLLPMHLKLASDRWKNVVEVNEARGTIIYCYVEQSRDPETVGSDAKKLLRNVARDSGIAALPIIVVLLCDERGTLGQALAELAVLDESITEADRVRFGNLVGAHKEKMLQSFRKQVRDMITERRYVTALKDEIEAKRLGPVGTEIFGRIYKKPLPFPFDGFSTARGNAADSCQELTRELLQGSLDFDVLIAKPTKTKNRAIAVLKDSWGSFTKAGAISRRPTHPITQAITEKWDEILQSDQERFIIGEVLKQACMPPYGANIASAGLLLGVFVAPRVDKIAVIRDGRQYAVSQWVQDGIFNGKFLDLQSLHDVELALVGEASSEWEALFDEWEQAESYFARSQYLERSHKLKERIPVPPLFRYRFRFLTDQGRTALEALNKMAKDKEDADSKLENGYARSNVSLLSWGAAILLKLKERMVSEQPLWTDYQVQEIQPEIERARQKIIQIFPDWLGRQRPINESPEVIGEFKHKMITVIGGGLKQLGLNAQYEDLVAQTNLLIKNAQTAADAQQLARDVSSWLEQHKDVFRIIRIAEIRGLLGIGKEYAAKLKGMAQRIDMPQLAGVRSRLAEFTGALKDAESAAMKRGSRLWQSKLRSTEEIDTLLYEVGELVRMFEGCQTDLEDLHLIRGVLLTYQRAYKQLDNENLSWQEFDALADRLLHEAKTAFDEEEIPWPADETIKGFVDIISKQRKQTSLSWIQAIESEATKISEMSVGDANRLYAKTINPPAILTDQHAERLKTVSDKVQQHLHLLELEWLIERFRQLPEPSKKKFLKVASEILSGP